MDMDAMWHAYGELTVRIGLNLQAGQRLIIIGPVISGGVSLEVASLVREIAASAYRAGAPLVEVLWGDEQLQRLRLAHAPRPSFHQFSAWCHRRLSTMWMQGTRFCRFTRTIRIC